MRRNASLELSANLIVVIIISLVIFSSGILLTKNLYDWANRERIPEEIERQIWEMMNQGQPVANPLSKTEVQRGDMARFYIGINNILDTPTSRFKITVTPSSINDLLDTNTASWISLNRNEIKLNNGGRDVVLLGINVPRNANRGTYAFVINVTYDTDKKYAEPERVTVVVR